MSNSTHLDMVQLYPYLFDHSVRECELLHRLREETAQDPMSRMQIAPEQGQFMALLIQLTNSKKAIEVGTFTGYSAICVARALPDDGQLICCDLSEEWTNIAKRYWQEAELEDKIQLKLAPALDTLNQLLQNGGENQYDFLFIDADKTNYDHYYERGLSLLRQGGLMAIDNVLWSGRVADNSNQEADTVAIRALNKKLHHDDRVDISMLPVADGLTLVRKR